MRKIVVSIILGLLFAGVGTHIIYSPCPPGDDTLPAGESLSRCAEHVKAIDRPHDLLHNKQSSLVHFSENFVIASVACFAIISLYNSVQKKRKVNA